MILKLNIIIRSISSLSVDRVYREQRLLYLALIQGTLSFICKLRLEWCGKLIAIFKVVRVLEQILITLSILVITWEAICFSIIQFILIFNLIWRLLSLFNAIFSHWSLQVFVSLLTSYIPNAKLGRSCFIILHNSLRIGNCLAHFLFIFCILEFIFLNGQQLCSFCTNNTNYSLIKLFFRIKFSSTYPIFNKIINKEFI